MPAMPGPVADEKSSLLAFLNQQHQNFRTVAYGLTDDQARLAPTASTLSVGALIKHAAACEAGWVDRIAAAPGYPAADSVPFEEAAAAYAAQYRMSEADTLEGLLAALDEQERITETIVQAADLDADVPVPRNAPWFPRDIEAWSVRWVLGHLIEELSRHAGHADIIRESVDGATWFELMAGIDGMAETPWLKPWQPA
ncbi:DinB family protein [Zhihengliuella sp.]|uniref:DinB family protein n=1 Tax=Zhihengliuella sp. TaxID=1954483 RepID=UPI0028112F84|nr:DinB family protein [Zhihengliuella sp.]